MECVERGLDPFTTNLVVADPERSVSTICLAITPAMKAIGVKNRCRIHEIPKGIEYITAMPRMQLYIDYSTRIYQCYLRYIAPEDIHIYSIDECFIDATQYLELYHVDAFTFAEQLMHTVMEETGITASVGIGTNLYLAKIAMDILAKKSKTHIAYLDENGFREKLWDHKPLTDFWMIGSGTAARLAKYGAFTMGDIARLSICSEDLLFKVFGVDAELLIDHAWGVESCTMADIKHYKTDSHSLSNGQVLMRDYSFEEARVIIREMADVLVMDMLEKGLESDSFSIMVMYDHKAGVPGTGGTVSFFSKTSSAQRIIEGIVALYDKVADRETGIRRLNVCANRVTEESGVQFDLFSDPKDMMKERRLQEAILTVKHRFGKNALIRGTNLLDCSTYCERNRQIGGHRA